MSALGQERTSPVDPSNVALPPKADIERHDWHVRFVPKADLRTATKSTAIRSPRRRRAHRSRSTPSRNAGAGVWIAAKPPVPGGHDGSRMTVLRRRGKLCYGSFLKIHPRFQSAAALRAADSGEDDDRGERRLWIRSDAPFWPRAPRRPRWRQRRVCLLSSRHKEELPCASMKKAPSASITRRPVPASHCCS